jgi:beta-lactam-binding protein with PASTA domain/predicted Ser/Thr protein kinase
MTAQARLLGDRYQVGELLGYGGMAEVHKGRDLRLGRDVAIKMLRTDLARDSTFQERFRREAQNSAALNHPAIVAVYDTGEEISAAGEKQPFIVMEFVNGRTLKEVLAAEQRFQPRRALEVIADICAALEFSHRHGIIHRDIKPGNVMVTQNGQVKVMDFGIARALASGATTMTQTSAVIGTAQYLSPEQARGESVDARSDVYAAGCVLFELLCGHPPFVGDSPVSVAYQHVREDPKAPSDINHDVPPDVDAIVLKALAKNPLNRYQSAQEMRADALRAVSGRPVLATPVMTEAETMAMAGPPRQPGVTTRPIPAGVVGQPEERRTSSWVMAVLAGLGVLAVIALGVGLYMTGNGKKDLDAGKVPMPTLTGLTEQQAQLEITKNKLTGITAGDPIKEDCGKSQGKVTKQDPAPGTLTDLTSIGSYQICAGPDDVQIPGGLIGNQFELVESTLKGLGLQVTKKLKASAEPENSVLSLSPDSGTTLAKGSTVNVTVSSGGLKQLPSVVGQPVADADAQLRAAGFTNIRHIDGRIVGSDDTITVEKQTPSPGNVKATTLITLTVTKPTDASPSADPSDSPSPATSGGSGAGDGIGGLLNR